MSKEALKRWRMLIPGILLLAWSLPILFGEYKLSVALLDPKNILIVITVVVLGGLYDLFNFRRFAMIDPINVIHKNIRDRLSAPYKGTTGFERLDDLTDQDFLRIFYSIIDNDKSLSDQSSDVRLNGLYLSTACDLRVTSLFASAFYSLVVAYCLWGLGSVPEYAIGSAVAALALFLLSMWLVRRAQKEHLLLGDEQLAHITERKELKESLREKLQHRLQSHSSGVLHAK